MFRNMHNRQTRLNLGNLKRLKVAHKEKYVSTLENEIFSRIVIKVYESLGLGTITCISDASKSLVSVPAYLTFC